MIVLEKQKTTHEDTVNQIVKSLETYLDRGEYHHANLSEAVYCLDLAGYEIEMNDTM